MHIRIAVVVAVILLLTTTANGQVPQKLSFQGFVTNPGGTPIDTASVGMTFKLYRNGSHIWTEHHPTVAVKHGVFNVRLGEATPLTTIAFNLPIELGITVGGDAEMSPRTPLTTAAYAKALPGLYTYYRDEGSRSSYNVVGGDPNNIVDSNVTGATIGGGGGNYNGVSPNSILDDFGTVSGGVGNTVTKLGSTIAGGMGNTATGFLASVGGGIDNTAKGDRGVVAGGEDNVAGQIGSAVPGGIANVAQGAYSFAAGHGAKALHLGSFVWNGALLESDSLRSTDAFQFLIGAEGGVGIGTNAPDGNLHVSGKEGDAIVTLEADTDNIGETDNPVIKMRQDGGIVGVSIGFDESGFGSNNVGIGRRYNSIDYFDTFVIEAYDGDVGIGTNSPGNNRLHVRNNVGGGVPTSTVYAENSSTSAGIAGTFVSNGTDATMVITNNSTGDLIRAFATGLRFAVRNNGDVRADGSFATPATDLAEIFEVEGSASGYEPGDVLVISVKNRRTLERSSEPVSNLVAGVYATKPGVVLGTPVEGKTVPMGVVGVLPTKVCTQNGSIQIGDLLVTSSTPGHAMKATSAVVAGIQIYPVGAILGKALESFDGSGSGLIDVLVGVR